MAKDNKKKPIDLTLEELLTPKTIHVDNDDLVTQENSVAPETVRVDGDAIASSGTIHVDDGVIGSPVASQTAHVGGTNIISSGFSNIRDSITLNGVTYQHENVISKSTGEAEIHLLSINTKKCVLKLYWPNFKPKESILKKLKQINHEDIVNLLDYGYNDDRFFEVMDYAEGGSLNEHLPIKDIATLKGIVGEVINAYKYLHSNDLIHKDIKPENLFYKNSDRTDILIADFGISTSLDSGMTRNLTKQNLTAGYAAPEMYGLGDQSIVGKEVDYYALGITILHLWSGGSPFEGLQIQQIANLTTSGNVRFPESLPSVIEKLVKGLITIDYTKRWGYDEVSRWLNGEDVPVYFQTINVNSKPFKFNSTVEVSTVEELAETMKLSSGAGTKLLYRGKISAWINLFNSDLSAELDKVVEDDYPSDQSAGFQKSLYLMDLQMPFTYVNKEASSASELVDILEKYFDHFLISLKNANHDFYLYLEARDAKDEADAFRKYFQIFSAKKSLNTVILELRGRESFKINNQAFFTPAEILNYQDKAFLEKELKDKESSLSLWIEGTDDNNIKAQLDDWRSLKKNDQATLAYVSPTGNGIPQIEISKSSFSFNDVRVRTQTIDSFTVTNKGGGTLSGAITSNKNWLQVKQDNLDSKKNTQEIKFTVNTDKLSYDTKETAIIEIDSNVGREEVEVKLSIEEGVKAAARFRSVMIFVAALLGGMIGFFLYKLNINGQSLNIARIAGLIGAFGNAIVIGISETGNKSGKSFESGNFIWAILIGCLAVEAMSYLPQLDVAFSTLAWAFLFVSIAALSAPTILKGLQLGRKTKPILIGISTVILSVSIICFGSIYGRKLDESGVSIKRSSTQRNQGQTVYSNTKQNYESNKSTTKGVEHLTSSIIRNIQTKLYQLGYYKGNIDGKYGRMTKSSLKKWMITKGYKRDDVTQYHLQLLLNEIIPKNNLSQRPTNIKQRKSQKIKVVSKFSGTGLEKTRIEAVPVGRYIDKNGCIIEPNGNFVIGFRDDCM